jgi:2-deoxy-D-gluconate 3-dehydrogenase
MGVANPFDFRGATVAIAGATGGLGRPITQAFAAAGARLALCARTKAALEEVAEEARTLGAEVVATPVDLCVQEAATAWVEDAAAAFQHLDVLVNLVGGIVRRPSLDYALADWEAVMDVNLKACWLTCQAAGRVMIAQRAGRIVNFASNAGLHGVPGYPAYSPAKAGVIALTRVLAVEWGPFGICVNALSPGFAATPFNADVLADPRRVEAILRRMPLGRVLPADALVGPTLFLASPAARWVNGHTLVVDTGFHAT